MTIASLFNSAWMWQCRPANQFTPTLCRQLSSRVQAGLEENPFDRHAVPLGQLAPAKAIVLNPQGESAWLIFERGCIANGQKLGDIKPFASHSGTQWPEVFAVAQREPIDGR